MYGPSDWKQEIKGLYERITLDLIKQNSRPLRTGNQLDVVKEQVTIPVTANGKRADTPL